MRIFITGASGFVGGEVVRRLGAEHQFLALARGEAASARVRALGATAVAGDLEAVRPEHLGGCQAVIHAAALARPYGRRDEYWRANVDGTRRLVEAARAAGVRRFVHVSTEAVCFDGGDLIDLDETRPLPVRHRYDYCASKAEGERHVLAAAAPGRFEPIALRPSWVWGPGDTNALPMMVDMVKAGKFMWVDAGRAVKTTTHVANLVEGIRLALTAGTPGKAYFVNDAQPLPLRDFLTRLMATQGLALPGKSVPGWLIQLVGGLAETAWRLGGSRGKPAGTRLEAAFMRAQVSIRCDLARRELGWRPVVTIDEGLAELRQRGAAVAPAVPATA